MLLKLVDLFTFFAIVLRAGTLVFQSLLLGGVLFVLWVARASPEAPEEGIGRVQASSWRLLRIGAIGLRTIGLTVLGTAGTEKGLEARGIAFVSLRDNLDLGTPSGRLMFQIIGSVRPGTETARITAHLWTKLSPEVNHDHPPPVRQRIRCRSS